MKTEHLRQSFNLLGYDVNEIRVIQPNRTANPSQLIHFYSDLLPICQKYDGQANIYIGINERTKINATKRDIHAVNFVVVDVDSVRPDKNQPANQQELDATIEVSELIVDWFVENEFCKPIRAISGNGCHIWARIPQFTLTSLEMTEQWELKVKRLYQQIKSILSDDLKQKVWIDSIQDVTRIMKLIGTTSVKTNPTKDRPNRISSWLDNPESIVEDFKLFDYLQTKTVESSLIPSNENFVSALGIEGDFSDLDGLDTTQLTNLNRAINSYHVQQARKRIDDTNLSKSDYALMMELAREGILESELLKFALKTTPGTKYHRDQNLSYVNLTVDKFINQLSKNGLWLNQAQQKLVDQFKQIEIDQPQVIVCGASVGTGKTYNAIRKVEEAVENNVNVLILVPTHALAHEWETRLDLDETKSVIRLYGITNPEVGCPSNTKENRRLMKTGHSTIFRQKYCASCPLKDNCKHLESLNLAEESDVLIAQHRHLNLFPGFLQKQHGNRWRTLVVIDEMPDLVNVEKISFSDIEQNRELFQQLVETETSQGLENVIDFLAQLEEAHDQRQDIQLSHDWIHKLNHIDFEELNQVVVDYYAKNNQKPNYRNLLWDLLNISILNPKLEYCKDEGHKENRDVLTYRWTPNFNHKTVLLLSGTVKSEYIAKQLNQPVQGIAEGWSIIRKNLKVVQLTASVGGYLTLGKEIQNGQFYHKHGKLFDLILKKHQGQAIAIVTSAGKDRIAKYKVKEALQLIADDHNVKLTCIDNLVQQTIPSGIEEIPIFHWKMEGLDILKGRFEVIWEMNAHYHPEDAIKIDVKEKFGVDSNQMKRTFAYLPMVDFFNQNQLKAKCLIWNHWLAQMEVDHTQTANMIQTEARFLREDEIHKTIYRIHTVRFEPYPTRIYQSWKLMLEQEFEDYISPLDILNPKEKEIYDWIEANYNYLEFKVKDISSGMSLDQDNVRTKYLKKLVDLRLLEKRKINRKNYYRLIILD